MRWNMLQKAEAFHRDESVFHQSESDSLWLLLRNLFKKQILCCQSRIKRMKEFLFKVTSLYYRTTNPQTIHLLCIAGLSRSTLQRRLPSDNLFVNIQFFKRTKQKARRDSRSVWFFSVTWKHQKLNQKFILPIHDGDSFCSFILHHCCAYLVFVSVSI